MYLLFILTVKSIFSSVIGSQFYAWYSTTNIGIYFQARVNQFMEYISNKYDIELTKKQSKFEADYPQMMDRIEKLEKWSHPDRQKEFKKIIKEIERKIK